VVVRTVRAMPDHAMPGAPRSSRKGAQFQVGGVSILVWDALNGLIHLGHIKPPAT